MPKDILREVAGYVTKKRRRRTWKKIVSALACVVVFCTTYALILPALTLEKTPQCGKTEHTHSSACYTQTETVSRTVLVCTPESLGLHQHTDACLDENGEYCCGYSDFVVHQHNDSCYDEDGNLWCTLPEVGVHKHDESCYAQLQPEFIPFEPNPADAGIQPVEPVTETMDAGTKPASTGIESAGVESAETKTAEAEPAKAESAEIRTGSADVGTKFVQQKAEPVQRELICGKEEVILHEHNADCFDGNGNLICGQIQVLEHVHNEECFQTIEEPTGEKTLTCKFEEHTHSDACFSGQIDNPEVDPTADLESADIWEATLPETISEKWQKAVLMVAESQLGYQESVENYISDENGRMKGYTRYGEWYGDAYGDWCAMFVSFCLHYADIPEETFPQEASCPRWIEDLQKEEYDLYREKEDYTPKPGDVIFFDWNEDKTADHVGLVAELLEATETEPAKIRTIEGNSKDCVCYAEYEVDDVDILGYGELPQEPRTEYTWNQDGMEVLMSVPQDENLPEHANLVVERLTPEDQESDYGEKYAASQEQISAETTASITHFDPFKVYLEADGEEVLPQKEATVEIRLSEEQYPVSENTELFCYSEDGAATPAADLHEEAGSLSGSFDTELSAAYAVVETAAYSTDTPPANAQDRGIEADIVQHKTIDAFRDGANNPDTDVDDTAADKTDLYRLYLDAQVTAVQKPIDLLIVVDQSGSMHNDYSEPYGDDMTKENGVKAYRDEALRLVLNGTSSSDPSAYKGEGLIAEFLAANKENQVAVVGFQGNGYGGGWPKPDRYGSIYRYELTDDGKLADVTDGYYKENGGVFTFKKVDSGIRDTQECLEAATLLNWTSAPEFVNVQGIFANATNYCAAFVQAQRALDEVADNGHQKVILFLSDGVPTCHIAEGTDWRGNTYYYRAGNGQNGEDGTDDATDTYFDKFISDNPDAILHTVSICSGEAEKRLIDMAKAGHGSCYGVKNTEDLQEALRKLMFSTSYTELAIEDTLSSYVDLYETPDFKVTMTVENGTVKTLFENGVITPDGDGILESVSYEQSTKKVTAKFVSTYRAETKSTYTLSFNIVTKQEAYQEYAQKGYSGVTGAQGTDYANNATSSEQGGFHSNASATVSYKEPEKTDLMVKAYPHPVVQVATCKIVIEKTDSRDPTKKLAGAKFDLYRKALPGETDGVDLPSLEGKYIKLNADKYATDANGQFVVEGLIPGDYWLVEIEAPENYQKLETPVSIKLTRGTNGQGQIEGSSETIDINGESLPGIRITNNPWGHELPQTGGFGTLPYTMGGLLLITAAAALLLYKKKTCRKEDIASS